MSCVNWRQTHVFIILASRSFRTISAFALSSQCRRLNLWESLQSKTFGFCEEKSAFLSSRLATFTFAWNSPPPSETPVSVWARLRSRLPEIKTPYSKIQICLATVMKTQRFAFCFPQWERALIPLGTVRLTDWRYLTQVWSLNLDRRWKHVAQTRCRPCLICLMRGWSVTSAGQFHCPKMCVICVKPLPTKRILFASLGCWELLR